MSLRDRAIDAVWAWAAGLGPVGRSRLQRVWGRTVGRLPLRGQRQWAANVLDATGVAPTRGDVREASSSWLRNALESVSLENWTGAQIDDAVVIGEDDWARLRASFASRGTVLALGHLGSWDLCGAWVGRRGMPVSSVAERLPDARFEHFLEARAAVGMRIHSLDEPDLMSALAHDVTDGRLVCLLADRDLKRNGVEVRWPTPSGGRAITVPPGPALLARRTGADLMTVISHYEGDRMRITIGQPISHASGRDGLAAMMQAVVDDIAAGVAARPVDWHVFGRFFRS